MINAIMASQLQRFYDLQAVDPEKDPVSYSIVSGNDLRQFAIGDKSGIITVIRKLDREDLTRYQLVSWDILGVPKSIFFLFNNHRSLCQSTGYSALFARLASRPISSVLITSTRGLNCFTKRCFDTRAIRVAVFFFFFFHRLTCFLQAIKAEDTGGLSSTATVNIKVTDINDKNPVFVDLPYKFSVKEGESHELIGHVHAEDSDEGINAQVTYFVPDDIPFTVDPETGNVLTKVALDYEQNHVSFSSLIHFSLQAGFSKCQPLWCNNFFFHRKRKRRTIQSKEIAQLYWWKWDVHVNVIDVNVKCEFIKDPTLGAMSYLNFLHFPTDCTVFLETKYIVKERIVDLFGNL